MGLSRDSPFFIGVCYLLSVRFINQYRRDMEMLELIAKLNKKFGEKNYKILKLHWNGIKGEGVVLVDRSENHESFVTWVFSETGDTFSGDYHDLQSTALNSFRIRSGRIL